MLTHGGSRHCDDRSTSRPSTVTEVTSTSFTSRVDLQPTRRPHHRISMRSESKSRVAVCVPSKYCRIHLSSCAARARCREAAPTSASRTLVAESFSCLLTSANCHTAAAPSAACRNIE